MKKYLAQALIAYSMVSAQISGHFKSKEEKTVQAGMVVSLSRDFLVRGHDQLVKTMLNKINRLGREDGHSIQLNMGDHLADYLVPGVTLSVSSFEILSDDEVLATPKYIELSKACKCIEGSFGPVDRLNLSFDYQFDYVGIAAPITGSAEMSLFNLQVDYKLKPQMVNGPGSELLHDKGQLYLELKDLKMQADRYPIRIQGMREYEIKPAFTSLLQSYLSVDQPLTTQQVLGIEQMINEEIFAYNQHSLIYNQTMEIDSQLVADGLSVTDEAITVIMDGTFHTVLENQLIYGQTDKEHDYGTPLPLHQTQRGAAQAIISDYALTSLLSASLELYCHNLSEGMDGGTIDSYIDGFAAKYGLATDVKVICVPVTDKQKMVIEPGSKKKETANTVVDGLINVYIQNPFNSAEDSVYLQMVYEATVEINIRSDFKLTGQVSKVRTSVKEYKAYFDTKTEKATLSKQISQLSPDIASYMNLRLDEGLELPLPSWLSSLTTRPRFRQYKGYYLFDAEPIEHSYESGQPFQ